MTQIITNNSGGGGGSKVIVVDDLNTPSSTSALSANQGYVLKGMIDDLMAQGRFLSLWNCATGQPISFPMSTPYTYSTGDYFMVEVLDSGDPATNYRPNGSSYSGTASSTVETGEVVIGDYYVYDGAVWLLASNHGKTVSFANLAGQPTDNVPLGTALAGKQDNWIEVTVNTAYNTAAKVGTTTAGNYTPTNGDFLLVNFVNGCQVNNPTLAIDGGDAISIYTGSSKANSNTIMLGGTAGSNVKIILYYDGTYYRTRSTYNTTYSVMSVSEGKTGTSTSSRIMRADYLKQIIKYHSVSDTAYDSTWDGETNIAPSKNAVYDKIESLNLPIVSSTAPATPTEGMIWYDTTNDVLKTYDGSQWNEAGGGGGGGDSTIKAFYLSSTSDLVTAQAVYDWFNAGKTPLLVLDDGSVLTVYNSSNSSLCFTYSASYLSSENDTNGDTIVNIEVLYINLSNGTVTDLEWVGEDKGWGHYLETGYDYPTPYTPQYDGSPATKKYVDDAISGVSASVVSGDSGVTYTIKVSNSDPASGTASNIITLVP